MSDLLMLWLGAGLAVNPAAPPPVGAGRVLIFPNLVQHGRVLHSPIHRHMNWLLFDDGIHRNYTLNTFQPEFVDKSLF